MARNFDGIETGTCTDSELRATRFTELPSNIRLRCARSHRPGVSGTPDCRTGLTLDSCSLQPFITPSRSQITLNNPRPRKYRGPFVRERVIDKEKRDAVQLFFGRD